MILTTNWGDLFELSYENLKASSAVVIPGRSSEYLHRATPRLPVRFRKDVARTFAELKANLRVLKLHGDFFLRQAEGNSSARMRILDMSSRAKWLYRPF